MTRAQPNHPHQSEALERRAASLLAEAEMLDAAWNRLRVAQALGDRWRERAAAEQYTGAWPAEPRPDPGGLFARATQLALEVRIGGAPDAAEHFAATVRELHAADPAFRPDDYARRVPWRCDWVPAGPGGEREPLPDVKAARAAWLKRVAAAEPAQGELPPAREADASALREASRRALARQATWPDPLVERHHRELIAALDAARTSTEVALAAAHADACLAAEADWNALLHAALLAPLRAVCGAADPDRATAVATDLLGADPRTLARTAEVLDAAARLAREPEVTFGAQAGEAGFELLRDLRAHLAAGGSVPVLDRARDPLPITLPRRPVPLPEPRL